MSRRVAAGLALAAGSWPEAARAHMVGAQLGDFYAGALHLLVSLEQVVVVAGAALLTALQPPAVGRWIVLAFPLGVAAAAFVVPQPAGGALPTALGATFLVIGLAVAAAVRLPLVLFGALGVGAGLMVGFYNVAEFGAVLDPAIFVLGVVSAGCVVMIALGALAALLVGRYAWSRIALRALGSWVAAAGCLLLVLAIVHPSYRDRAVPAAASERAPRP